MHKWSHKNPRSCKPRAFQQRFSVNLWVGIIGDYLNGLYLLPSVWDGWKYRIFVEEILPKLLENVPTYVRRVMWFQHDGAPAYFANAVRDYLNKTFPQHGLGAEDPYHGDLDHPIKLYGFLLLGRSENHCLRNARWHRHRDCRKNLRGNCKHLWNAWYFWTYSTINASPLWSLHKCEWESFWALVVKLSVHEL